MLNPRFVTLVALIGLTGAASGCAVRVAPRHRPAPPPPAAAAVAQPAATPVGPAATPAATPAGPAATPGARVTPLGTRTVSFVGDKDTIMVTGQQGLFRKLRLRVSGSPLEMYNVRVVFGDGTAYSPNTRLDFAQGSWTRAIDLPGNKRVIRKIEFWYRSKGPRTGRATVQAFGIS